MVGLVHVTRWEKRNRMDFYWKMLLIYTIWEYWILCHTWYSSKTFAKSSNFFVFWFWYICTKIYTWKYLEKYVLISRVVLKSLNQNVSIRFVNNIYIENIRAVCHKIIHEDLLYFKIFKNFFNFSCRISWSENVLILPSPKISQG